MRIALKRFPVNGASVTMVQADTLKPGERDAAASVWQDHIDSTMAERKGLKICDQADRSAQRRQLKGDWLLAEKSGDRYGTFRNDWMRKNRSDTDPQPGLETLMLYAEAAGAWVGGLLLYNLDARPTANGVNALAYAAPGFADHDLAGRVMAQFLRSDLPMAGRGQFFSLLEWQFPRDRPEHRWTLSCSAAILKPLAHFPASYETDDRGRSYVTSVRRLP